MLQHCVRVGTMLFLLTLYIYTGKKKKPTIIYLMYTIIHLFGLNVRFWLPFGKNNNNKPFLNKLLTQYAN